MCRTGTKASPPLAQNVQLFEQLNVEFSFVIRNTSHTSHSEYHSFVYYLQQTLSSQKGENASVTYFSYVFSYFF
jgi:hypothetical protein